MFRILSIPEDLYEKIVKIKNYTKNITHALIWMLFFEINPKLEGCQNRFTNVIMRLGTSTNLTKQ